MSNSEDFAKPDGLSDRGELAYKIISEYLKRNNLTFTGGCKLFHNPKYWDHDYGRRSHLIVCYEGAAAKRALSFDGAYEYARPGTDCYALMEGLTDELRKHGMFFEQCTLWYSAVYDI